MLSYSIVRESVFVDAGWCCGGEKELLRLLVLRGGVENYCGDGDRSRPYVQELLSISAENGDISMVRCSGYVVVRSALWTGCRG